MAERRVGRHPPSNNRRHAISTGSAGEEAISGARQKLNVAYAHICLLIAGGVGWAAGAWAVGASGLGASLLGGLYAGGIRRAPHRRGG